MSAFDWFKKAKEKAEKKKSNKGSRGAMGSGSKAYDEAASALDEEENPDKKKEAQYASEE